MVKTDRMRKKLKVNSIICMKIIYLVLLIEINLINTIFPSKRGEQMSTENNGELQYLTVLEFSKALGIHESTAYKYIKRGFISKIKTLKDVCILI